MLLKIAMEIQSAKAADEAFPYSHSLKSK